MMKSAKTLTKEQQLVIDIVPELVTDGLVCRIIAGAGVGKTTTLVHLAETLLKEKRHNILYLVFNKLAQREAEQRFAYLGNRIKCATMHSAALQGQSKLKYGTPIVAQSENVLIGKVTAMYHNEIKCWLQTNSRSRTGTQAEIEVIGLWIYKSLEFWLRSADPLSKLSDSCSRFTYYPAKLKHVQKFGFAPKSFYTQKALAIWRKMWTGELPITHDAYIKRAQLGDFNIPNYTIILLDESQDTTAAQVSLFVQQQTTKPPDGYKSSNASKIKDVFIVGDSVQCIYSFRGAKPKIITNLDDTTDFSLTSSFRFGPMIAEVANRLLWIKENSPQKDTFVPYRLNGKGAGNGEVLRSDVKMDYPYTIVARGNNTLITLALEELIRDPNVRIQMNGAAAYRTTVKEVLDIYRLKSGERPQMAQFERFIDYDSFKKFAIDLEKQAYKVLISLVETYKEDLPAVMASFLERVLDRKYEVVDVILSTTHKAKGMEWDQVRVANDFIDLEVADGQNTSLAPASQMERKSSKFEFRLANYGDDLNCWYVAATRAKIRLQMPPKYWKLMDFIANVEAYDLSGPSPLKKLKITAEAKEQFKVKEEVVHIKDEFRIIGDVVNITQKIEGHNLGLNMSDLLEDTLHSDFQADEDPRSKIDTSYSRVQIKSLKKLFATFYT